MNALAVRMVAFRRSIEYVQDYIDLAGLKIWQEELSRVIYYNIEQECNRFLKKKVRVRTGFVSCVLARSWCLYDWRYQAAGFTGFFVCLTNRYTTIRANSSLALFPSPGSPL